LKIVAEGVTRLSNEDRGFVVITHYQRMLDYITPDAVHVFLDGRIVQTGGAALADEIEASGYDDYRSGAVTT
ncbi:MAG: Fe-S cluster assembly ATPase SufC, partial [Actinomycetota bacterium]|nr:Fe-S cluster assembly ATPase SufC [Actinomycetota bacterium]